VGKSGEAAAKDAVEKKRSDPAPIGHNTKAGRELNEFIERVERCRKRKKDAADDEKVVMAEAKSKGFDAQGIRHVVKMRAAKPQEREEWETIRDTYMHAAGMATEPPLFRQMRALASDKASSDQVCEALAKLVPENGDMIFRHEGRQKRIWRDKNGDAHIEDYTPTEPKQSGENAAAAPPPKEVPDCTEAEAEELGAEAYKNNTPIIENPFPYDDKRRPRWDKGWRKASGSDGMGPK
jgi:uncharacterized protein (UPF0335 family)